MLADDDKTSLGFKCVCVSVCVFLNKIITRSPGPRGDFNMMIRESPGTNPLYHFQKEEENIRMKV